MKLEVVSTGAEAREARLCRSVQALAAEPPSAAEAKRRPTVAGYGENLVFEFDEAYTAYVDGFEVLPSEAQLLALQAVDREVSAMVRAADTALWTEGARREEPHWRALRAAAADVLRVFEGWAEASS